MKSIRFMCMSPEELVDFVEKVECMHTIPECKSYLMDAYRYHGIVYTFFKSLILYNYDSNNK